MISAYAGTILLVTGILTATLLVGAAIPRFMLSFSLGMDQPDSTTVMIARHWFLLLGLVGGLLIYAAYHPEARVPALVIGFVEKVLFAALVFTSPLRKRTVTALAAGADTIMALFFLALLASPQTL
jgi:hypothetical protein